MKKFLLTILCALFGIYGMAQSEKIYTEPLVVTVDGESTEPQDASVTVVDNGDGTINFELKNFILSAEGFDLYVGTIYVENIATEAGEGGLTHFSYNGDITILEGDLEGVDTWFGPDLSPIPVVLNGKMTDDKLFATIDIEFGGQVIHVQLGTDDFDQSQREGTVYTEPLIVIVDGESSEPQDADVVVYDNEDDTIDFELKNFILSAEGFDLYVGTIYVKNIATEAGEGGLTHFSYNGDITILEGDLEGVDTWFGPDLSPIPVVLNGKMTDDKLFATIDIEFGGQVIHVQLGTDDFSVSKKGDVNGDGEITIADGVAVLNAMAGEEVTGDADVNGDGEVTIADFVAVLNLMAEQ